MQQNPTLPPAPVARLAGILAAALIVLATLTPAGSGGGGGGSALCLLCGERGAADFLLNIGLFAPLGAALALGGLSLRRALFLAGLFTLGVEAAQVWAVPGRDATAGDLVSNTVGAGAGWCFFRGWERAHRLSPSGARWLGSAAAGAAVVLLVVGLSLLKPSFTDATYFLQWTPALGHLAEYDGRVFDSGVGPLGLHGPPGPIDRTDSVRELLREEAPVKVRFRVGSPTERLAPIFSIYDARQREILLVGAQGEDLVYRYRTQGEALRLDGGTVRFAGALEGLREGQVVDLAVRRDTRGYRADIGSRTIRSPGMAVTDTWTLLYHSPGWSLRTQTWIGVLWLVGVFVPVGLFSTGWRGAVTAGVVAGAGLTLGSLLLGFSAPLAKLWLAPLAGIAAGAGLAAGARRYRVAQAVPSR